jgi:DNA-binding beta-propeller fold protein YncE
MKTDDCVRRPPRPVVEPNGKIQLAAVGQHVTVVNLRSERIERNIDVGKFAQPAGVAVAPDGTKVYVTYGQYGPYGSDVAVIDARTDRVEHRIPLRTLGRNEGAEDIAIVPGGREAFVSAFEVVTPGPYGPVPLRGVIPVNLVKDIALPKISFGEPVFYGISTGAVIFGR